MKNILYIIYFILISAFSSNAQNAPCCPQFILQDLNNSGKVPCMTCDTIPAPKDTSSSHGTGAGGAGGTAPRPTAMAVCKNSYATFVVYPNLPLFTYQWTIVGGVPATITNGNPVTILWGSGNTGSITVVISNGQGCTQTITRSVCLKDKPTAGFTYLPVTNICTGTNITFTNTSSGAASYIWLFGDGSSTQTVNPQHQYGSAGTYTVTLVASNAGAGSVNGKGGCGCVDTIKKTIVVGDGPGIETCNKMLCPGDTAVYCSTTNCTSYAWTFTGATLYGPANQKCVKLVWNTAPGSLTLTTTGCGACNTNAIVPSVIWNTLPFTGPTTVCIGSTNTYSLPTIPGTFYSWTIIGSGASILNGGTYPNNFPVNNPMVNVNFTQAGSYVLTCTYHNPNTAKNCGGVTNIPITVVPKFKISALTTYCQNTSGTFTTTDFSFAIWTVTGPAGGFSPGTFPNGSSINVNWLLPGTYVLTAVPTIPGNYCNPTGVTLTITVNPAPVLSFNTPQTLVCVNSLTNYSVTANIPGNITWSFLSGTGTINPYGANNTSASVQFTGSGPWTLQASETLNGCSGTTTVNITKVPPPPVPTIIPGGSICSGQTVTVSVTGAIPPGGYTWSATPGAVYVSGQGTTSATYIVNSNATISINNCSGTSSVNATVTAITVTASSVTGSCAAVITASAGASNYAWFLNGQPAGTGNPITVYQNGSYVLQATFPGGCIATTTVSVTGIIPVVASISSIGNLCNGGSVTLQAVMQGNCTGASYAWSNGGTGSIHVVTSPGTYYVTVTCAGGCTLVSNPITVYPCDTSHGCINDLIISHSPCNNPMTFTATGSGCSGPYSWYYGDGYSNNTGIHTYNNVGNYTVTVVQHCTNGTTHCGQTTIQIPFADSFTHVISCGTNGWQVQLQDASLSLIGFGYTPQWTTTCGSLNASNIPNPVLTIPFGCNPTITLKIIVGGCTYTKSYAYNLPTTPLSINAPAVVCKGQTSSYSSSYTTGIISYSWNFGDGTTGTTNPISHTYNGAVINPTITLIIKDQFGCIFTVTRTVTVIIPPALSITPGPLVKICPNCSPPSTLSTSPLTGFTGYQWYHNGAPIFGANGATYQLCIGNASGNYYVTAISNTGPCPVMSDTVMVVYNPLPDAIIHPRSIQCAFSFPVNISSSIYSGVVFNPNCTYTWYLNNTGNQIFTSNTTNFLTYTVNAPICDVFIVKVTDNTTGCYAYDTACICFSQNPSVSISPTGAFCAGTPLTFTAIAGPLTPTAYTYVWQDATTGQVYTTSFAGMYTVTAADKYGCSNSNSVFINQIPYVALFPQGCVTLCDTAHLYFPIPLTTFGTPAYTITWYEGVNVLGTGYSIPINTLSLGLHNIFAKVIMNGCAATTAMLNLTIKHCGIDVCCPGTWSSVTMTTVTGIGVKKPLQCGSKYDLKCGEKVNINAKFKCNTDTCKSKVTYTLTGPALSMSGTVSFTFAATQNGVYYLTLYGWCNKSICDSCKIIFLVTDCTHSPGCCKDLLKSIKLDQKVVNNKLIINTNMSAGPVKMKKVSVSLVDFQVHHAKDCDRCEKDPKNMGNITAPNSTVPWKFAPAGVSYSHLIGWKDSLGKDWSSGIPLSFEVPLPAQSAISCCCDTIFYCLKYSFTDINCVTCDTIVCYSTFNGKGCNNQQTGCCGDAKWNPVNTIKYTDDQGIQKKEIPCFDKGRYIVAGTNVLYNATAFACQKDCKVSYEWKLIDVNTNTTVNSGSSGTMPVNFTAPASIGSYEFIISPTCGGSACDSCGFYFKTIDGGKLK